MAFELLFKKIHWLIILALLAINFAPISSENFIDHESKGVLYDANEVELQSGILWTGHPDVFKDYHPSLSSDLYLGIRKCVKKTVIVTQYTECFERKKMNYYLKGPTRISEFVTCQKNTTCHIEPFKSTKFNTVIPKIVGQGLRNYIQTTIALEHHHPLHAPTKLSHAIRFQFEGPGTKAIYRNPIYTEITGKHEYFEIHGGMGDWFAEDIQPLIPRRLKTVTLTVLPMLDSVRFFEKLMRRYYREEGDW